MKTYSYYPFDGACPCCGERGIAPVFRTRELGFMEQAARDTLRFLERKLGWRLPVNG